MLEHSALYLNAPPSFEDESDASFFPDFFAAAAAATTATTRLGPCELQDPFWAKMNSLSGANNKKRKKSEAKPQAQINKCNNEKRRREQENIYIEELAELISANFADMSSLSVKPDKCAILQETVNQIRSIKQRENAVQSSDPVQQGEVSSSRPTILSNEVFGPLLLEALEGFLFVVNGEGKVEQVTENVVNYIKFTKEDVLGKSIYNFIHHGDHAKFSAGLLPMSIGWANETTNRSRSFSIRLLVKPPEDLEESVEEKQQRVSSYELMHILSAQLGDQVAVSNEEGSDSGPCLLCVASRISYKDKTITGIEQFTTKLDTSGKIIGVDTSGVSSVYSQYVNRDLMHKVLKDFVSPQDVHKFNAHLRETLTSGQSSSVFYRLQFGIDKVIQVQTKSKLFKTNSNSTEADFVMATHSIIGESDSLGPTDPGGGNSNNSVGGPLMTSVVNGTRNSASAGANLDSSTSSSLLNSSTSSYTPFTIENDFNFDMFPSSTWELDSTSWPEARPDSRQSVTPVSTPTPRPPSNPAFSPVTSVAQSPLASFVAQPSPTIPNPSTPANPYSNNFPFSPLPEQNYSSLEEQKDTKANVLEDAASSMMVDSNKLRNLLTKPPTTTTTAVDSANDNDSRNKNRILKGLLNQQDEDECRNENSRSLHGRGPIPGPSELPKNSSVASGRNNMLLELLNDKSDDDDLEARGGVKKKSELLQQLLKTERTDENDDKKESQVQDDTLLRSLGFSSSPSPPERSKKRSSDGDESSNKRTSDGKVTSTGSELCRKNQMLVSLLAKHTPNHQPIPPIPASILHATPQEKLPKVVDPNLSKSNRTTNQHALQQQQQQLQQTQQQTMINNRLTRMPNRPQTNYLNSILSPQNNMQQRTDINRLPQGVSGGCFTSPATSNSDNNNTWAENNNMQSTNDPYLSDILDQVMDFVPDDLMHLLDSVDSQPATYQTGDMSEKMAIHIIQKSLMRDVENAIKSPTSPNVAISGTPPSYSSATLPNNAGRVFPPPPNYPQQGFKVGQRVIRQNYPITGVSISNPQQLLMHQQRKALAQQQEKKRLLQQQQQQQLLIPPNATAAEMNSGIQNIDSLLNNTVAPNVSLQRSASVPEPQSSPNYNHNQISQASRVNSGGQQPYSPHSQLTSSIQQNFPSQATQSGNYQQNAARLSPQSAFTQQQLSPRQAYPQGNANWTQARLTVQNPMLNAQLTRAPQQQRTLSSPGTRHSPFAADSFPPPTSPNAAFNQNQYLRVQRANSTPTATTHLPGGLGSPRPYGRADHHSHPYSPIPPQPSPSHHPMMYQPDAQYCYDQTGIQLAFSGADRGRAPPHLHPGVSGSGPTSEFVRQELRAVVGARTQSQTQQQQQPQNRTSTQQQQQQQQQLISPQQQVSDLEVLGLSFESAGASDSPKLWGAMGSDMGSLSPQQASSGNTMEELRQGDHSNKSSLLQKLLSE